MPDPDLDITAGRVGGGGGGGIKTLRKGGGGLQKMFSAIRASVWSKNKGGGGGSRAPPLDPPLKGLYFLC